MSSNPKVGVVILNFKVKEETLLCLKSVASSNYQNLFTVVVDNNSEDNIEVELKKEKVEFIQSGGNKGFSGGNNLGIKKALDLGADFVFVLNPDTRIDRNCISEFVKGLEANLSIGVAGPKILFADEPSKEKAGFLPKGNKKTIWYGGGIFDIKNVLGSHRGMDEQDKGQYDREGEVDFASGAACFIRKEVFETVGYFDERYFLYYEDADFCLRAKEKGFKIMYLPKAVVVHDNAKSTGLGSPLQDYFITRNRMIFAKLHLSKRTQFALLREALRNLNNPTRRLALLDFLSGKFGKGSFLK